MGVMTSYGSYNRRDKPVIRDNFIISISNSLFSFVCGFVVFCIIGYLRESGNVFSRQVAYIGLTFIALPTATAEMSGANFWNIMLFLTLFLLGIDTAFSMVEAITTVLKDTPLGKMNRMLIALIICVLGFILSLAFCADIGYVLLDVVDHYITTYTLLTIGILQ
jgi:SNF family Na+-dependent transporter